MDLKHSFHTGIFMNRLDFDKWSFMVHYSNEVSYGTVIDLYYLGNHTPILESILYTVECTPETSIIDGKRLPWSDKIRTMYFPACKFSPDMDIEYLTKTQIVKTPECASWLRFDLEFKIQALIPTIPYKKYVKTLLNGPSGLHKLVYEYGGVDPLVLRRHPEATMEMIQDAVILDIIRSCMKKHRCVWLSDKECPQIIVDDMDTKNSMKRLIAKKVVTVKLFDGDTQPKIALSWAATQYEKCPPCSAKHSTQWTPCTLSKNLNQECVSGNRFMAVDNIINMNKITLTMCPQVSWGQDSVQSPRIKSMKYLPNTKAVTEYINTELANLGQEFTKTILTFSESGTWGFEKYGTWTCLMKQGEGESLSTKLVQVKKCVLDSHAILIDSTQVDKVAALPYLEYVSKCTWSTLPRFKHTSPQLAISIFTTPFELRWVPWLEQFQGTRHIMVKMFKNSTDESGDGRMFT